jgi:hypothetical protein
MSEDDLTQYEAYARIRDHHYAIADVYDKLIKGKTKKMESPKETISEEPFKNLKYETAKGDRLGDYEICFKEHNKIEEFQHCNNVLVANGASISNHFTQESWLHYYWKYEKHLDRFYRKKKATAETKVVMEEKKAIKDVRMLFPESLEGMLSFEETENFIVIKPRQFLGSENFAKIAAICRDGGGEYISAGKESHFRIPRKTS